ncbi:uncharacterized protein DDB_G0284459-like [Leptopilina boulardi]|uniref:uncharacterized protein DDB_G0284459-like n=1 Tax=Leptopilina boulardi TaxID=63433 RepID=UPI0021F5BB0A|nr:uncharacterized protein DDB_G0284459-like [Leptopilina boulardi]
MTDTSVATDSVSDPKVNVETNSPPTGSKSGEENPGAVTDTDTDDTSNSNDILETNSSQISSKSDEENSTTKTNTGTNDSNALKENTGSQGPPSTSNLGEDTVKKIKNGSGRSGGDGKLARAAAFKVTKEAEKLKKKEEQEKKKKKEETSKRETNKREKSRDRERSRDRNARRDRKRSRSKSSKSKQEQDQARYKPKYWENGKNSGGYRGSRANGGNRNDKEQKKIIIVNKGGNIFC